jgi:16S rRNA C967 or C1407 C5-methylase (RsmB/RsmF family)
MELIEAAARVVKPGGLLIYSTCSFAPEENEFVINSLIDKFDIKVEALPFGSEGLTFFAEYNFNNDMKNTRRLYPHLHNTMGFYIAKLRVNS